MSISGKTAIVTGAASGIGQGVAIRLAQDGASVVCADINSSQSTLDAIAAGGGKGTEHRIDVSHAEQWLELVKMAESTFGTVELLVNVAGITPGANPDGADTVLDVSQEHWDRVLSINLNSVWYGMRSVIPGMRMIGGGRIVNTTSLAALRGMLGTASYAASKGAIIGLTQQAAAEYAPDNILINAIAPGMILTPVKESNVDFFQERAAEKHLIGRLGLASEVGACVAFLLSDASFLTGHTIPVDGGWTMRG